MHRFPRTIGTLFFFSEAGLTRPTSDVAFYMKPPWCSGILPDASQVFREAGAAGFFAGRSRCKANGRHSATCAQASAGFQP
jgi:hypothetical protein